MRHRAGGTKRWKLEVEIRKFPLNRGVFPLESLPSDTILHMSFWVWRRVSRKLFTSQFDAVFLHAVAITGRRNNANLPLIVQI